VPTFRRTSNNIWPKFRKVMKHSKPMFMANARIEGKGGRRFFSTNREAETWAQLQRVKRQNEGGPRIPGRRACGLWMERSGRHPVRVGSPPTPSGQRSARTGHHPVYRKEADDGPQRTVLQRSADAARKTPAEFPRFHHSADQHPGARGLSIAHESGGETRNTHRRDIRTLCFVSNRLASTQNAPETALESGHDQAILFAHYRELVRPKDAERFFSIIEGKAQIVQGSRMAGGGALHGGMPYVRYIPNRVLTFLENIVFGRKWPTFTAAICFTLAACSNALPLNNSRTITTSTPK
jgi:hypothetical protein